VPSALFALKCQADASLFTDRVKRTANARWQRRRRCMNFGRLQFIAARWLYENALRVGGGGGVDSGLQWEPGRPRLENIIAFVCGLTCTEEKR
jgi:hypothetical protein